MRIRTITRFFAAATAFTAVLSCFSLSKRQASAKGEVSKAECVMEVNSRRVLYQSHGDLRLPMASTTKILTAATVLELADDLQAEIVIPPEAEGVEGSSVYLKAGDTYTVEDLLYGLMLRSGNDCATALAYHFSGGVKGFATEMNKVAEKAGALDSHFENPHGLPCEGHYTTAKDLSSITCLAMQNEKFQTIVSTKYYEPRNWKNKNKMLYQYEGAIGVKTGYTRQAGRCLVSAANRENMTLVCTVLGCAPTYERSSKLLNDAFSAYEYAELLISGDTFKADVEGKKTEGYVKESFSYPLLQAEKEWIEYRIQPIEGGALGKNKEKIIGQLEIYLAKQLLFSTNLYKL